MAYRRDLSTVTHQLKYDLRTLEDGYVTSEELDKLETLLRAVTEFTKQVNQRRSCEMWPEYPLKQSGRPFRTLAPSGRTNYFETLDLALAHAEKRSEALGNGASVAVERWHPRSHQDGLNAGWACIGFGTNGTYKGTTDGRLKD